MLRWHPEILSVVPLPAPTTYASPAGSSFASHLHSGAQANRVTAIRHIAALSRGKGNEVQHLVVRRAFTKKCPILPASLSHFVSQSKTHVPIWSWSVRDAFPPTGKALRVTTPSLASMRWRWVIFQQEGQQTFWSVIQSCSVLFLSWQDWETLENDACMIHIYHFNNIRFLSTSKDARRLYLLVS